ncbi:MAG: hypothetical protein UHZ05_07440 [Acutalibacteraceae bacterium]|nr:hypothetical protein [Clostridia bacterium]MBQ2420975.1 hypothetical protein [Clostridia bacterium]MBQ5901647.1 hypothetical protein [Clostridia bacterium]MEE1128056.1 hypothetical protein [Acutalibacteraceae bacterium]
MNFNPMAFIDNLGYMGVGMLGIMLVIGTIIVVTVLLNFFGNKFDKKDSE